MNLVRFKLHLTGMTETISKTTLRWIENNR